MRMASGSSTLAAKSGIGLARQADMGKATVSSINAVIDKISASGKVTANEASKGWKIVAGGDIAGRKPYLQPIDPNRGKAVSITYHIIDGTDLALTNEKKSILDFSTQEYDEVWQKVMKHLDEY